MILESYETDELTIPRKLHDELVRPICRAVTDDDPDLGQLGLVYDRCQSAADIRFLVLGGSNQCIG